VRRQDQPTEWRSVKFLVFDAPTTEGPFEARLQRCRKHFNDCPSLYFDVLPQQKCLGADHLYRELERVEQLGGEGLMLRLQGSLYEAGRSPSLLKVKRFVDAEAVVVDHEPGRGRHQGRVGALVCEWQGGVRFAVGSGLTDSERERPPRIGSTITFRYQELTDRGAPRFPTYIRRRSDLASAG
jgi:DNA ligase-1